MDRQLEHALQELIEKLEKKGFFMKYCHLVCPDAQKEICEDCPYTKREILEFWAVEAQEEITGQDE